MNLVPVVECVCAGVRGWVKVTQRSYINFVNCFSEVRTFL